MIEEAKKLKKDEVTFGTNQEILLISHQDKRLVNMISTLHTAEVIETTSRQMGVAKKKPKGITDYNTHMQVLIQWTSIWLTTHSFVKLLSGPRKYFSIFSNVAFSSHVTFSKDNPNSHIPFLDFMSDITENLIHTSDAVSSPSSTSDKSQGSSRTPTPTPPKRAPKNEPLAGLMEN